jgi:DEAD/DEAH box helicase domain-containing protein
VNSLQSRGLNVLPARYGVFDLETKFSAQEVGGWNRADRMGMSVGVVYDSKLDGYTTYLEDDTADMIEHLRSLDLVIGFNNKRFDNQVLSAYTACDLYRLPTLDILEEVYTRLSYRLSLDRLAEHTLGHRKSADGLQALKWYKEGKIEEIVSYCKKDVELTRNLLLHDLEHGYLLFKNKAGAVVRLPLHLDKAVLKRTAG